MINWNYDTKRELTNYDRGEQKNIKKMLYNDYMNGFLTGTIGTIVVILLIIWGMS